MKVSPVFARAGLSLGQLRVTTALSGCVNVRYDDEHADRSTRMYLVAQHGGGSL